MGAIFAVIELKRYSRMSLEAYSFGAGSALEAFYAVHHWPCYDLRH